MDSIFWIGMLAGTVRLATPILLAALGETVNQRAGVMNVGIEGSMLMGAFFAALGAVHTGTPWGGLVAGIIAGTMLSAIHAWMSITLKVDQIVSGIAMVVLGLGLTGFGFRITLGATSPAVAVPQFERLSFAGLAELPWIGPIVFHHHAPVYLGLVAALAVWWFLKYTERGLEIRAAGENPEAAVAVGIDVAALRYGCTLFGGAMAGAGGAFLAIAQLSGFVENMVSGRGFIAIACVVFGRWNPAGVVLASLFFGMADAAQIRLQTLNPDIPYQFFVVMPYALAIVSLVFLAGSARMPAALGIPFFGNRRRR